MYKKLFLPLFFFLFLNQGFSQVTIGSQDAPIAGALLDLKQSGTTSKGLGLPRVKLTDAKQLFPMFTSDGLGGYTGYTKANEDEAHIGLIVYATDQFCKDNDLYQPGMYVWDGSEWTEIYAASEAPELTFSDGEGNTYTYKDYGGTKWMTQNVRTIYKKGIPANGPIDGTNGIRINMARHTTYKVIAAPLPSGPSDYMEYYEQKAGELTPTTIRLTYEESADKFGLFYNAEQAELACPDGWRLPTINDVVALAEFLGDNSWDGFSQILHAGKMLKGSYDMSYSIVGDTPVLWDGGAPCPVGQNAGFKAFPTSYAESSGSAGLGDGAWWWLADKINPSSGYYKFNINSGSDVITIYWYRDTDYLSVRCIQ